MKKILMLALCGALAVALLGCSSPVESVSASEDDSGVNDIVADDELSDVASEPAGETYSEESAQGGIVTDSFENITFDISSDYYKYEETDGTVYYYFSDEPSEGDLYFQMFPDELLYAEPSVVMETIARGIGGRDDVFDFWAEDEQSGKFEFARKFTYTLNSEGTEYSVVNYAIALDDDIYIVGEVLPTQSQKYGFEIIDGVYNSIVH